jgi:hypothetical protein
MVALIGNEPQFPDELDAPGCQKEMLFLVLGERKPRKNSLGCFQS